MSTKFANMDEGVAEYSRLETEGHEIAGKLKAAGVPVPVRPYLTQFRTAIQADSNFSPENVILALGDYVNELRALAESKGLVPKASLKASTQTHQAAPAPGSKVAAETTKPKAAGPLTATQTLLASRNVDSLEALAGTVQRSHKNFSLPLKK